MTSVAGEDDSARLDRTFAALAHPARRAILARLARGPASATELGTPLAMSQPAVSRHLKVLEDAGLIARGRDAQWRPCELRTEPLQAADAWVSAFRRTWEQRLDRLGAYLTDHDDIPRRQQGGPGEHKQQDNEQREQCDD
ncbi:MAG: metalloregulator ArsR/SmtB family transcription factor [Actinomycetota bacterium]|jgi:DNA-binding transcriptional ArsR family regulator|nr:metalloregulator ArsR/SmtB family transcription factor [Actinomycetota bacterium]